MINTHYLEVPLSRTYHHGPKGVRAIEFLLYIVFFRLVMVDTTAVIQRYCWHCNTSLNAILTPRFSADSWSVGLKKLIGHVSPVWSQS